MPGVSKEEIANARKMDLLSYLRAYEPGELVRFSGETYCTRTHDSLKISNGKWYWFSQNIGGRSALDYLVKVKEMSFPEAVKMLNGQAVQPICYEKPPPAPRKLLLPSLDVRIRRWRVRAVLGAVPLPGGGLTVQPLPHVGKGPTVIAVTAAVAVAVAGFDSVKAFQGNNALRNQGHSAGRVARVSLVGDFPNDRLTVVKRACIFDKRTDGKRIQTLGHCFSLSLNRF